ncbi:hypothetical protein WMF39_18750 [Sorangium sp. So ce1504]|uniref:hypothetical protein n=1 Tax=Sorangium sp. So ce1504 TaxID=3133337 RepID=UPI003F5FB6AF
MQLLNIPSPGAQIEFLEFQQPALESGTYEVEVKQTLRGAPASNPQETIQEEFPQRLTFEVTGERFGPLSPTDIAAVFPPPDSVGEHANVLPHITLRRSTLPWERFPGQEGKDENLSWLVLLLLRASDFGEGEKEPEPKSITVRELLATQPETAYFPELLKEHGQQDDDLVTVIDVPRRILEPLLPSAAELAWLAHARQRVTQNNAVESEAEATVLCKRLPEPGGKSTVHLVSVERRYKADGTFDFTFDFQEAGPTDLIRLVSLARWTFHCVDPAQSFSALLEKLDREPGVLRAPVMEEMTTEAAAWIEQGHVPVVHRMRQGNRTVSFYRGPLLPGPNPDTVSLEDVQCADQLLRYHPDSGLLDVSYAAAWELGRLLTLDNTRVALELFNWKRQTAHQEHTLRQRSVRRLPRGRQRAEVSSAKPQRVAEWFQGLTRLVGLPFSYLVPEERLLPAESLRFFWLDPVWVDCLTDGALSVGRVTEADVVHDRRLRARMALRQGGPAVTGFLIRSSVVSGWPDLLVEGYPERVDDAGFIPDRGDTLKLLRFDRLADDVLICLFEGEIKTLDVHQKPEAMHFGLDARDDPADPYSKNLRTRDGTGEEELLIERVPWSDERKGILDIPALAAQMKEKLGWDSFTAAQFALQMIEGVQKVRFLSEG